MTRLGRTELFARLGRVQLAEQMFAAASERFEEREWREHALKAPHGVPWYGSFHASRFPGDDERACERALLYELLAIPQAEPFSRMLRGTMVVGQACEDWNVANLSLDGRLLSPPASAEHQIRFEDQDHWLTGSADIVVLPPFSNRPHLVETKTKDHEVVVEMKDAKRSYDAKHARQCRAVIAVASRVAHLLWPQVAVCSRTWRIAKDDPGFELEAMVCPDHGVHADSGCLTVVDLQPLRTGTLLYMSRNRPSVTCGYFFEHDEAWFQRGLVVLERARQHFLAGELPPHPFGGKNWSEQPCRFCDHKRESCKPDHKAGVTRLVDSKSIDWAREVYGHYDIEQITRSIVDRWSGRSGFRGVLPRDERAASAA